MGRWDKGITVQRAIGVGRFGRWTIIDKSDTNPYVLVLCDCGNTGEVRADSLLNSHTRSCGCLAKELSGNRARTHGNTYKPLFYVWHDMNRRCYDTRRKDYPLYGGQGVSVCERWNKLNPDGYQNFIDDMGMPVGDKKEVDRIDNNGNYSPDNCKWASRRQQTNNQCLNRHITSDGFTLTCAEWGHLLGVSGRIINDRIGKLKWDNDKALATPFRKKERKYVINGDIINTAQLHKLSRLSPSKFFKIIRENRLDIIGEIVAGSIQEHPDNMQGRSYQEVIRFLRTGVGIDDAYSLDIYEKYRSNL